MVCTAEFFQYVHLFQTIQINPFSLDSDEEVTVTHYSKAPNVSVTQNSKNLSDCTQQLLKDGYRLDEISDEEDLDLIPPRSVDDRCQCCGAVTWQGCIIS